MARVALVCEPPDGGVAEHVAQLALGLARHGHDAVVMAPAGFRPGERLAAAGRPPVTIAMGRDYAHPWRDAAALAALTRALRRGGFDLVHGHAAKAGVLARIAARTLGLPSVYTPHCLPWVGDHSAARRRFGVLVERALAPATAAIVCVSEDERRIALDAGLGRRTRLAVVHNGSPPDDPALPADPALVRLREQGPVVAAVTVLRRQKRVDLLLDATPAVLAAVPEARIAVVGEGPELPALRERAARLGLRDEPRLAWLPFTAPAARHLKAVDVYVLPSAWEAFPIGVLEALACGVPQVATDVGGTGEAVTPDTGVLVEPGNAGALAEAIVALLRDPERRLRMSHASTARHAERFTVGRMLEGTAAVYDRVLTAGVDR